VDLEAQTTAMTSLPNSSLAASSSMQKQKNNIIFTYN
jgi:hypothetical protein